MRRRLIPVLLLTLGWSARPTADPGTPLDERLFYAIVKLNAARWDSHLRARVVKEGLQPFANRARDGNTNAPIRFKPDYTDRSAMFMFVSDFSRDIASLAGRTPKLGDKLIAVNGVRTDVYLRRLGEFIGRSSHRSLWWDMAYWLSVASINVDPSMYDGNRVTYELESRNGRRYKLALPYLKDESIQWMGHDDHYYGGELADLIREDPGFIHKTHQVRLSLARYRGFEHVFSRPSFDLYVSNARKVLVLQGHRFVPETIVADLEDLMTHARTNGLLDYAVIYDLTRGGGGDFEEYTLQRLQSRPFKLMFGNLRISDITPALVQQLRGMRGGPHLNDWLDNDVAAAIRAGQAYTNDVQFEGQFLPPTSDGYVQAAKEHFTGPMVLFTAPSACSGADQFAAMFNDNELGLSVGMPQGGCSNTWEWEETLKFPISGKPVVAFSWSVGHSIRPNGQVLEGNSALPRVSVPLTRDNYSKYYDILMGHALTYIDSQRASKVRPPTKRDRITSELTKVKFLWLRGPAADDTARVVRGVSVTLLDPSSADAIVCPRGSVRRRKGGQMSAPKF